MQYKQYTIVIPGNRFGEFLSETMEGYYTKWRVKYRINKYNGREYMTLVDVKAKEISLSPSEISKRTIERTMDFYDDTQIPDPARAYPAWLEELKNQKEAVKQC